MQVQLTFRRMNPSYEIERQVFKEAEKLDRVYPQLLMWCHVVIEQSHHQHEGRPCRVRVAVQGASGYYVASRANGTEAVPENLHAAITEAFQAVRSQVQSRTHVTEAFQAVRSQVQSRTHVNEPTLERGRPRLHQEVPVWH